MFRKKKPLEIHYLPGISCFKQKIGLCCEDIRLISCKLMALSFIEFNAPPSGKIHFSFASYWSSLPESKNRGQVILWAQIWLTAVLAETVMKLLFRFYRDCAGVEADTNALIHFKSSCFGDDTLTIYQIPGTGQEISPICRNDTTTCNGGEFTGSRNTFTRV